MAFEVHYTYNSQDYRLFPYDGTENIGYRNIVGFPINTITAIESNEEGHVCLIPGRYRVTFDSSPKAYIDCPDMPNHPYINLSGVSIDISTGNSNKNVIPGLDIQFSTYLLDYFYCDIIIGNIWIEDEAKNKKVLDFGYTQNGLDSDSITLTIKNVSGGTLSDITALILNKATVDRDDIENVFSIYQRDILNPVAFPSRTNKEISFSNLSEGTVQLLVDSVGTDMIDTTDDTAKPEGKALSVNGTTPYMFDEGTDYQGITTILSSSLSGSETVNFLVTPGSGAWKVKLSTDSSWTMGYTGISIGSLDDDESIDINIMCSPPSDLDLDLNPIEGILQLVDGTTSDSIGLICNVIGWHESLVFRVGVISEDVQNKLAEFGITYAT